MGRASFSSYQKVEMERSAKQLGWTLKGSDLKSVERWCQSIGVSLKQFRIWMANHKDDHLRVISGDEKRATRVVRRPDLNGACEGGEMQSVHIGPSTSTVGFGTGNLSPGLVGGTVRGEIQVHGGGDVGKSVAVDAGGDACGREVGGSSVQAQQRGRRPRPPFEFFLLLRRNHFEDTVVCRAVD